MNNLKQARVKKGFTQEDVSRNLGMSRGAYTNYELGKRDPDTETLVKLADLLGVTTDYLLGIDDNPCRVHFASSFCCSTSG